MPEPALSHEHDAHRWASTAEAVRLTVWPTYRETIERITGTLLDPQAEPWFRLDLEGRRLAR